MENKLQPSDLIANTVKAESDPKRNSHILPMASLLEKSKKSKKKKSR